MKRTILLFPLAFCLCLLSCKREAPSSSEPHDEHGKHEKEGEEHQEAGENLVQIKHSMLRDLRVTTQAAESRPAGDTVLALGELRVNEEAYAEVGTAIPARVSRVLAAPGDKVRAGQPLVELDSAEVGRARAALLTTRARLDLAKQTVERRRGLAVDQIVPGREMQAAEAELAQADAESRAAQEILLALGASRGAGSRFVLTSPIAGTIIERSALVGKMVTAERSLFLIGDLARIWLVVHAFERDALRVRSKSTARVNFPALPGQALSGTITRIGSRVDPASRTVDIRIEIDNPTGILRPGMSASALVALGEAAGNVVTVPVEAIQRQAQGWCVFIPRKEEGQFEIRPVGRGRDLGAEVEVVSGLRAGERIVVDGAFLLKAEADKALGGEGQHHH